MPQMNRKQMIASALSIARRKRAAGGSIPRRADGGDTPSFPDMVAQNPRGWGTAPPPMPEPTQGQIDAARDYLRQKDAVGNPDSDLAGVADKIGQFGYTMTGIPAAQRAGQDFAQGRYLEGAGNTALAAAPYVGGPALSLAAKYGPKIAAPAIGAAAMFTPSEAGPEGPEGEITRLETQKAKLMATRDAATSQFLDASQGVSNELTGKGKTGKPGKGPASDALAAQASSIGDVAKQYNQDLQKIQDRIDYLHSTLTPEYARQQNLAQENADARKPWYERTGVPGFEQAANWGPWLGAAALTRGKFNKISGEGETLLGNAQNAASIGDRTAAQVALDAWKKGAPGEYAATAGKAALLPGGVRTTGNIGDAVFGPEVKDAQGNVQPGGAKQQAQHTLGRMFGSEGWQGAAQEWGPQVAAGADATALGAMLARRPPMGGISGELAHLRGIDPSLAPDQMAVEMAKRRAALPESGANISTGPTPSWSTSMRGESSRPALPPPPALAPSDTNADLKSARPTTPLRIAPPTVEPPPPVSTSPPSASPAPAPEVVKPKKYPDGTWRHPGTGNFVSAPTKAAKAKSTANKAQVQPKPKATAQDDVPLDKNGIPIKPPKEFDPDDPINRGRKAGGGVFSHAMSLARKYAKGGAVVGSIVGNTGGRTDALPVNVPAGSFVVPADCVSALGEGNSLSGQKNLERMFGASQRRADGGSVPIQISDGEFVVPPETVSKLGNGDMTAGHRALDNWVLKVRQDHINTLKSLPPPAR